MKRKRLNRNAIPLQGYHHPPSHPAKIKFFGNRLSLNMGGERYYKSGLRFVQEHNAVPWLVFLESLWTVTDRGVTDIALKVCDFGSHIFCHWKANSKVPGTYSCSLSPCFCQGWQPKLRFCLKPSKLQEGCEMECTRGLGDWPGWHPYAVRFNPNFGKKIIKFSAAVYSSLSEISVSIVWFFTLPWQPQNYPQLFGEISTLLTYFDISTFYIQNCKNRFFFLFFFTIR